MDFLALRREIIKKYFSKMNDKQFEAVTTVDGPLLVLAGAGSGKTTVLVNRILNLVKFGNAYNSSFLPKFSDEDVKQEADYLLCVKDNHPVLKKDIEDYVQDGMLQNTMSSVSKTEKNYGRIEIFKAEY